MLCQTPFPTHNPGFLTEKRGCVREQIGSFCDEGLTRFADWRFVTRHFFIRLSTFPSGGGEKNNSFCLLRTQTAVPRTATTECVSRRVYAPSDVDGEQKSHVSPARPAVVAWKEADRSW